MKPMRRDQRIAVHAYECVRKVQPAHQDDYRTAVNTLGPAILRDGLCAALAFLERNAKSAAYKQFFADLAAADIRGLSAGDIKSSTPGKQLALAEPEHALPERARRLDLDTYMLASREALLVAHWFKRAVQAVFED